MGEEGVGKVQEVGNGFAMCAAWVERVWGSE